METPKTGYQVQSYSVPVKRYCQTLDLRDSPEFLAFFQQAAPGMCSAEKLKPMERMFHLYNT